MEYNITTEERIDRYLMGQMSDSEKAAFEADLESDPELRTEYEVQKSISHAVQKVALRDLLIQHAQERERVAANAADTVVNPFKGIQDWIREFFYSGQRVAWAFASAAAMFIAIIGGVNYTSTLHSFQRIGMLAYAELQAPVARDGNQLDALLEEAFESIGTEQYDTALDALGKARVLAQEIVSTPASSEEEEYEQAIARQKIYEIDWYEALTFMKDGKVFKARKALRAISSSDSPFAEMARKALKKDL